MSLPKAPIERIIRRAGADRISEDAVEELRGAVEDAGADIAREAIQMAEHAGRNTVKKEDIEMATK
ncbi:MAG: histone family protein [Candidatus Nanohaloarchaea archaeon]